MIIVFGKEPVIALVSYITTPVLVFSILVVLAAFLKKFMPIVWRGFTGMREKSR